LIIEPGKQAADEEKGQGQTFCGGKTKAMRGRKRTT